VFDYTGESISFKRDDTVFVAKIRLDGLCEGEANGKYGRFPIEFIKNPNEEEKSSTQPKKSFAEPAILRKSVAQTDRLGLETSQEEEELNKRKSLRHSSMSFRKSMVLDPIRRTSSAVKFSTADDEDDNNNNNNLASLPQTTENLLTTTTNNGPLSSTPNSAHVHAHPLAMMGVDFVYEQK